MTIVKRFREWLALRRHPRTPPVFEKRGVTFVVVKAGTIAPGTPEPEWPSEEGARTVEAMLSPGARLEIGDRFEVQIVTPRRPWWRFWS